MGRARLAFLSLLLVLSLVLLYGRYRLGWLSPAEPASVFAIEYGYSPSYPLDELVLGAPTGVKVPFSWQVWLIRSEGRIILVDTGFADPARASYVDLERFWPVPEALAELGIAPTDVTDVVLTHLHWDHVGNVEPYADARFWVQRREMELARSLLGPEQPRAAAMRWEDLERLEAVAREGRLVQIDGDYALGADVLLHAGGSHTPGTQWVEVRRVGGGETVVLASDVAYLRESVERGMPNAVCLDPQENLQEIQRILQVASSRRLVIPGHDPSVVEGFERVGEGIARIR